MYLILTVIPPSLNMFAKCAFKDIQANAPKE